MPPENPPMPPAPQTAQQPKTSGLAIAALVFGLLGICIPCVPQLVAAVLAIVALVKIGKTGERGNVLAIVALVLAVVVIPIQGIVAAVAIPNFIKFQARAKQSECKSNLKMLYVSQRSLHAEQERFSEDAAELGFAPSGELNYGYFLSSEGPYRTADAPAAKGFTGVVPPGGVREPAEVPELQALQLGVSGECPDCEFVAACVGNLDQDAEVDAWAISSTRLEGQDGTLYPPGEPIQVANDL